MIDEQGLVIVEVGLTEGNEASEGMAQSITGWVAKGQDAAPSTGNLNGIWEIRAQLLVAAQPNRSKDRSGHPAERASARAFDSHGMFHRRRFVPHLRHRLL